MLADKGEACVCWYIYSSRKKSIKGNLKIIAHFIECLLSAWHCLNSVLGFPHPIVKTILQIGQYCIIIPILQMRKLTHRAKNLYPKVTAL